MLTAQPNKFTELLEVYRGARMYVSGVPGNSGDVLLKKGLSLYLETQGFTLTEHVADAGVLLIHGGGNIDDVWGVGITHLEKLAALNPRATLIIAPSTCHFSSTDFASVLNSCAQRVHFFTREHRSFARLSAMRLGPHVHIDVADDTAFLLEGSPFLAEQKARSTNEFTLAAFRSDRESRVVPFESHLYRGRASDRIAHWIAMQSVRRFLVREGVVVSGEALVVDDVSYRTFDTFVSKVCGASRIVTDRLHVAILGAMLGKTVHLYATRYDKIEGVYEYTLKHYPNVVLAQENHR